MNVSVLKSRLNNGREWAKHPCIMTNAHPESSPEIFVPTLLNRVHKILLMMHCGSHWTKRRSWLYWKFVIAQIVGFYFKHSRHTELSMLDFSMPILNSIFPFLEAVRPKSESAEAGFCIIMNRFGRFAMVNTSPIQLSLIMTRSLKQ